MTHLMRSASLRGRLLEQRADGEAAAIPPDPCLVEQLDAERVTVVWGETGEFSSVLRAKDVAQAVAEGDLVLLD